jgi:hypothetical protein
MATIKNWRYSTIERLEKQDFGNPKEALSNMIRRCLELCKMTCLTLQQF